MTEQWTQQYVRLAFHIDRIFRASGGWYVDNYYGPPEWKTMAEAEPDLPATALLHAVTELADTLPLQGYDSHRMDYIGKQLRAMETVCRKLDGESFPLEDEVQRCFDIALSWIPESQFDQGLAVLEEALPGPGPLRDRVAAWRHSWESPSDRDGLVRRLMVRALDEARQRTRRFVDLPAEEGVEPQVIHGKAYGAANWYLGNYHSRVELNVDVYVSLADLLPTMCHEAYPGHHTNHTMNDRTLYRERGYLEQSIYPIISPRLVIGEGIAMLAPEIVFTPEELYAYEWLPPDTGIEPLEVDSAKLVHAFDLLQGVSSNAAIMLSEGRSEDEVTQYLMRYTTHSEDGIRKMLSVLKVPLMEGYIFTYTAGKRLIQPLLRGPDRYQVFRRFLTEQLCASDIASWA